MTRLAPPFAAFMFSDAGAPFRVYSAAVRVEQVLPGGRLCVVRTTSGLSGVVPARWLREADR